MRGQGVVENLAQRMWCVEVQWLRLCPPDAGGPGSIPGQGTGYHMQQLRVCKSQLKILYVTTKT